MTLNEKSLAKLSGAHPDLAAVTKRAAEITTVEFIVTECRRTLERQRELMAKGASKTLRSRHLTGHAVDLAPVLFGEVRWDWPLFGHLAIAMKAAAKELDIPVEWGGDWANFKDGPHFQLPWATYPVT